MIMEERQDHILDPMSEIGPLLFEREVSRVKSERCG